MTPASARVLTAESDPAASADLQVAGATERGETVAPAELVEVVVDALARRPEPAIRELRAQSHLSLGPLLRAAE
jgi:hypothetical protein